MTDLYRDWESDGSSVVMKDFESRCSLHVRNSWFAYSQDSKSLETSRARMTDANRRLCEALQLDSFTRVGYRCKYLIAADMSFQALVVVMSERLLSNDLQLRETMPRTAKDLLYRVDAADDELEYHVTVGPVRKSEIPRFIGYNKRHHLDPSEADSTVSVIEDSYPDVGVYIDIDAYCHGDTISGESRDEIVEAARDRVQAMADGFAAYLFLDEVRE